jgi:hypothetical protein
MEFFAQIAQANGGTLFLGGDMHSDERAQTWAVAIVEVGHVPSNLLSSFGNHALQFLTKRFALIT